MQLKAIIPPGVAEITVNGLYQWDLGRQLDIICAEFGNEIMEVHFACPSMKVAIARPCSFTNGSGAVAIPNECLEQSKPITAWIYRLNDTQGRTVKTLILPIIARTKPTKAHDIPAEMINRYEELAAEAEGAVESLKNGDIIAGQATFAENANRANTAGTAQNATHAITAQKAETVNYAPTAGSMKMTLVSSCAITEGVGVTPGGLEFNTPYLVVYESDNDYVGSGLLIASSTRTRYHCPISHIYGVCITIPGVHYTELVGCDIEILDDTFLGGPITTENGTLYFYTFGKI